MVEGVIFKALSGFYYVRTASGNIECKARGLFRLQKNIPLVGDRVVVDMDQETENKGTIVEILKRSVELVRPAVANVDQAIIVFALKNPAPNMNLLDKLLVLCEYTGIEPVLAFNKYDLDDQHHFESYETIYRQAGYTLLKVSARVYGGVEPLRAVLKDRISVFCGPSGVGKSSILNAVQHGLKLKTGELSEKIQRGKHTTRHTELVELDFGGFVVDTPGFTSLTIDQIPMEEIRHYFPEFVALETKCRFQDCLHIDEPGCEVIRQLDEGSVHFSRYQSYKQMMYQKKEDRRNKTW